MILQLEIAAILRKTQNPLKIQVHFELEATWSSRAPTFQTPAIETCLDSFQGHTKILRRQFCIEVVYSILKKQLLIPVRKGTVCFQATAIFWNVTGFSTNSSPILTLPCRILCQSDAK